jgi:tetratricopeptide (TPR) repeat protein
MPRLSECLLASLVAVGALAGTSLNAQTAWDVPRFAAVPSALSKTATAVSPKAGTDVVVLDEEDDYVFDASGKSSHTRYIAYRVFTQQGVEGWSGIDIGWQPWHQQRPTLRARVITTDRVVHDLDPKTITDSAAKDDDDEVYGDGRVVRAPLPAVSPGAIVEEEETLTETAPFFGAGVVVRNYFGRNVPVVRARLTLDAPSGLPLKYKLELLGDRKPVRTEADGRVHVVVEVGPIEALDDMEQYLPSDSSGEPQVSFSTGASWQSIAAGYAKIVDEKVNAQDVRAVSSAVTSGRSARDEKVAAILQYLAREVRYTGVEFGDAAIVPHPPVETLKRKYGDCKDKATLAVAMLRAAGIPANLALLNAGGRQDVPTELPGMGLFDHAIVHLPGAPELWLDVTDQYARLGQIPSTDQGRWSLIAAEESTELVRVREASAEDNRITEKREFKLADYGPATIIETTEPRGVFESEFRSWYADVDNKQLRKNLTDYVGSQYLAKKLGEIRRSEPDDLSRPFQLTIHADSARRGLTELESAVVAIRLDTLFERLPDDLQRREPEPDKGVDPEKEKSKKPRTADFQLPRAFINEWQYHIVPPAGFQAKPLPPNARIALGPGIMTQEFSLDPDGSVRARVVFEIGKRRITATEGEQLRAGVAKLLEGAPVLIYFEPLTAALLQQGKAREAFQAGRNLVAEHGKVAVYRLRRASELLNAGMGQAAREEARAAVQLEPRSALAQKTLGFILEYDLVGRQYKRGSDFEGAEAAFRAAKKLDPDDNEIAGNLAILLEHNRDGERYGPGAKLQEAVAEYRALKEQDREKLGLKNNLAFALFYSGDCAAAKQEAELQNPQISAISVACEAVVRGTPAGMAEARKRTANDDERKNVLKTAGEMLMRARRYRLAADFMEAGASGSNASNTMGLAALLRNAQLHEKMKPEDTPAGLVTRMFLVLADRDLSLDKLAALESRNAQRVMQLASAETRQDLVNSGRYMRAQLGRFNLPSDIMLDIVIEALSIQQEGNDATGYRVTMRPPGAAKMVMFVVKEGGQYKLLDSSEKPNSLALEIVERIGRQDAAGARQLLDWMREEQHLPGGDDPLAGLAFSRLWTKGKEADIAAMRLAAASLLAQTPETAQEALPILEEARSSRATEADKLNVSLALLDAYQNLDAYEKQQALASELLKSHPESKRLFLDDLAALRGLKRFDEAEALTREMAKRLPDDLDVLRAPIFTAVSHGDYQTAHELGRKLLASGKAEASDMNGIAWNSLFTGKTDGDDLEAATRGAQLSQNSPGLLHTLGCVYAELARTKEARDVLIQAMDLLALDEPNADYWYAFGRIAEKYGEFDVARADYGKAEKPRKSVQVSSSSYQLAQLRLAALHPSSTSSH